MTAPPATCLRLVLITDRTLSTHPLEEIVSLAARGGGTAVMLRENDLAADALRDLAVRLRHATRAAGIALLVNHQVHLAREVGAEGVHLGWRSVSVRQAREVLGRNALIGVSTHSPEVARRAQEAGADYVTFGPVFATPSKMGRVAVQGIEGLRAARRAVTIPLVAVGGITAENADEVVAAGADGLAAIRALVGAENPEHAARELWRAAWAPASIPLAGNRRVDHQ